MELFVYRPPVLVGPGLLLIIGATGSHTLFCLFLPFDCHPDDLMAYRTSFFVVPVMMASVTLSFVMIRSMPFVSFRRLASRVADLVPS
ncbi:uncharacterized protein Dvar_77850 [Desulfosarcina variabilis str. Montpellier]